MGFWAGIKYALNSTLGTSEFQSLDKIIKGQKSLIKSQNLYYSFPELTFENVTSGKENEVIKELIKFKCSGSCRIVASKITGVSYLGIYVYINGTQVATGSDVLSAEVNFKVNDVLSIGLTEYVNSQKYTVNINDLGIYADVIDNSVIELL